MKVLHVRSSRGYYGAEALIEALVRGSHAVGVEAVVANLIDEREPHTELVDRLGSEGFEVARIRSSGRFDAAVPSRVAALARQTGADLVHTHDYKTAPLGLVGAWMARCPVVATFHGEVSDSARIRGYELVARTALRLYDGVALVSEAQQGVFGDPVRRAAPVFIPNAMDVSGFMARIEGLRHNGGRVAWRRALGVGPESVVVGTVGRLCEGKGQMAALPAIAQLMEVDPTLHWALAGEGEDRARLEAEVERLGLVGRVHLVGYVEDMARFYAGLDVLLHPSFREGLPMTILEGMSAALPILASPVGEIPSVVTAEVGALIEDRGESLRAHLGALMGAPQRAREMGEAGRERARLHYSAQRLARQYRSALYERALGGRMS